MTILRPIDLAREHGISVQAVRNHEAAGLLPPAARTAAGYRVYTAEHAAALRAHLALVRGHGHDAARRVMRAVHRGEPDTAFAVIADSHRQLLADHTTLDTVRSTAADLTGATTEVDDTTRTVGELAHRLRVTPATLRHWEDAGILTPARDPVTGYRVYRGADVRDAELAHLLRRGGHPLDRIATVVDRIRTVGGTEELATALAEWRARLTDRGRAMLTAAARLDAYLTLRESARP